MELDICETVGAQTSITFKVGGDKNGDICAVVIDMKGGQGSHVDIGEEVIWTNLGSGHIVKEIPPRINCLVYGSATVLYIKLKIIIGEWSEWENFEGQYRCWRPNSTCPGGYEYSYAPLPGSNSGDARERRKRR